MVSLKKLKYNKFFLKLISFFSFNRISVLPRGFGAIPVLEILDLTSNNLTEKSLPNNFFELSNF